MPLRPPSPQTTLQYVHAYHSPSMYSNTVSDITIRVHTAIRPRELRTYTRKMVDLIVSRLWFCLQRDTTIS